MKVTCFILYIYYLTLGSQEKVVCGAALFHSHFLERTIYFIADFDHVKGTVVKCKISMP